MAATALGLIGVQTIVRLPGIAPPVLSSPGTGTIYFDESSGVFMVSQDGSVYSNLVGGSGAPSGWTSDPGVVRLTTITDRVGVGTATPAVGTKLNVIGVGRFDVTGGKFEIGTVDAFAREQLWFTGLNSVLRLGADAADGDPSSIDSEGAIVYHPTGDQAARIKADRFGLTRASDSSLYYFRADETALFYRANPPGGAVHFYVDRTTGFVGLGSSAPAAAELLRVVGSARVEGDVLIPPANALDTTAAGGLKLGTTTATSIAIGNPAGGLSTLQVFINQGGAAVLGSNAGLQFSSTTANRGACRMNQFGANAGVPGITGFKSRGATVGALASCVVGDVLFRATAVGIPADNASFPLAGWLGIQVPTAGVGANYLATEFEVRLTPLAGPINGHKQAFLVGSDGKLHGREAANTFAGVAVLGAAGTVVVGNAQVTATTKFQLSVQDAGPAPTGMVYQSARVAATSFTIASSAGAADAGVAVYYQLWEPTAP